MSKRLVVKFYTMNVSRVRVKREVEHSVHVKVNDEVNASQPCERGLLKLHTQSLG